MITSAAPASANRRRRYSGEAGGMLALSAELKEGEKKWFYSNLFGTSQKLPE